MTAKIVVDELEIYRVAAVLTTFQRRKGNWQNSQINMYPMQVLF